MNKKESIKKENRKKKPTFDEIKDSATDTNAYYQKCFIASAAYGSSLAPQVTFLRHIRDENLRKSRIGNRLIDNFEWIYYKFSPYVAEAMYQDPLLKRVIRWLVVTPIVYFLMSIFKPADLIKDKRRKKRDGSS